jgi:hypothetical protein
MIRGLHLESEYRVKGKCQKELVDAYIFLMLIMANQGGPLGPDIHQEVTTDVDVWPS